MALYAGKPKGSAVELENLDVSELYIGTQVAELATGDIYVLTISDATVDHDDVEAVKDNGNLRWVKVVVEEG